VPDRSGAVLLACSAARMIPLACSATSRICSTVRRNWRSLADPFGIAGRLGFTEPAGGCPPGDLGGPLPVGAVQAGRHPPPRQCSGRAETCGCRPVLDGGVTMKRVHHDAVPGAPRGWPRLRWEAY
jgi:hypothetical protein